MPLVHSGCVTAEWVVSAKPTCRPFDNQRGDGGLGGARHQTDSSHGHGPENGARRPRSSLQQNLNTHTHKGVQVRLRYFILEADWFL